jgi:hypothetical protein
MSNNLFNYFIDQHRKVFVFEFDFTNGVTIKRVLYPVIGFPVHNDLPFGGSRLQTVCSVNHVTNNSTIQSSKIY